MGHSTYDVSYNEITILGNKILKRGYEKKRMARPVFKNCHMIRWESIKLQENRTSGPPDFCRNFLQPFFWAFYVFEFGMGHWALLVFILYQKFFEECGLEEDVSGGSDPPNIHHQVVWCWVLEPRLFFHHRYCLLWKKTRQFWKE